MSITASLSPEIVEAVAIVGKIVTFNDHQYKVHSVEGRDWYAFDDNGSTTVDCAMTPASWITFPIAMIIPTGHKVGEGFGREGVAVDQLKRGVCLAKSYA